MYVRCLPRRVAVEHASMSLKRQFHALYTELRNVCIGLKKLPFEYREAIILMPMTFHVRSRKSGWLPGVRRPHDRAEGAERLKTTKKRLSPEALKLIRQRGAARASGNYQLTSELAKLCRAATKADLKERQAEVLAEAAEAG
ncbi:unnamed protein product [Heligmosomoides polygyrus]|uniref:Transposase n=1 Tax=Heligmosomoides polygyrus TaxID=6339 RepID=A0A183FRX1_HELPZ|nr:unnamed protein product [Heligmosomoides polygyrus]